MEKAPSHMLINNVFRLWLPDLFITKAVQLKSFYLFHLAVIETGSRFIIMQWRPHKFHSLVGNYSKIMSSMVNRHSNQTYSSLNRIFRIQCDQIWQSFATLAIFRRFVFSTVQNLQIVQYIFTLLVTFYCYKWPNFIQII